MGGEAHGAVNGVLDITVFFWLLLAASLVAMAARRIRVPYALALVITGLVIGAPHLLPQAHLEPHTLFTVFLPPLLFESAINLRLEALRRNWYPIAVYAVAGTVLSTFIVGGLAAWALALPLPAALVFGALISPTDPISVIAVFKRLGVGKRLSLLVEAESLFNDGVAVVLFGLLMGAALGQPLTVVGTAREFFVGAVGGAGVGLGIGALASRVTREFDDHLLEIMLTTVVAFGAYLSAESVHVSGVIAVVAAGLVVGNYGMPTGMSPTTRLAVVSFWGYAAFLVNSIVFLLLGIEVTVVDLWGHIGIVLGAVGTVLVGRAIAVYLLSVPVNRLRGAVPASWQHVLVWGGLHGALSMALALGLAPDFPQRNTVVVITFGVVLFSLLAQGLTIGPLLKWLALTEPAGGAAEYRRLASMALASQAALKEMERLPEAGMLPRAVCDSVAQEFRRRLVELEKRIKALRLSDEGLRAQQVIEARRLALLAEKSALQEAERNGLVDESDLQPRIEEIDRQLAGGPAGGPPRAPAAPRRPAGAGARPPAPPAAPDADDAALRQPAGLTAQPGPCHNGGRRETPMTDQAKPPLLDAEAKWRRLHNWLHDKVKELQDGDLDRLPEGLAGQSAEAAIAAFETVLIAMDLIDTGQEA